MTSLKNDLRKKGGLIGILVFVGIAKGGNLKKLNPLAASVSPEIHFNRYFLKISVHAA